MKWSPRTLKLVDRRESYLLILGCFALVFMSLLVVRSDALPMMSWDESRLANNAVEAARFGNWAAPSYGGLVDHWNTKPPLLIWMIGGLLKIGLPPLWALRLPSIIAALVTLALILLVIERELRDRLAAILAASFLLTSQLFMGMHVARTGDYDALLSLFVFGYVLAFWRGFGETSKPFWLFAAAGLVCAAFLTKGVAGLIPLTGVGLFLICHPSRLRRLLRMWEAWLAAFIIVAVCAGYYVTREFYDPGYFMAVGESELWGRFNVPAKGHSEDIMFYAKDILKRFEPGSLFVPLGMWAYTRKNSRERDLILLALFAAGGLLVTLALSKTKYYWYAAPAVPLLSVVSGVGGAEGFRWLRIQRPWIFPYASALTVIALLLAVTSLEYNDYKHIRTPSQLGDFHSYYGQFISGIADPRAVGPTYVVDGGTSNQGGLIDYNPIIKFYETYLGLKWPIYRPGSGAGPTPGANVVTCDPEAVRWLSDHYQMAVSRRSRGCILASLVASRPGASEVVYQRQPDIHGPAPGC